MIGGSLCHVFPLRFPLHSPFPHSVHHSRLIVLLLLFLSASTSKPLLLFGLSSVLLPTPSCWTFVTSSVFVPTFILAPSGKCRRHYPPSPSPYFLSSSIQRNRCLLKIKTFDCVTVWKTRTAPYASVNIAKWLFLLNVHPVILLPSTLYWGWAQRKGWLENALSQSCERAKDPLF